MPEMHENTGNTLCINEYLGRLRKKITAENRDNDLISGYIGRSAEFRTLGLVVPNFELFVQKNFL